MTSLAASQALCIARKYTEALMDPDTRCLTSAHAAIRYIASARSGLVIDGSPPPDGSAEPITLYSATAGLRMEATPGCPVTNWRRPLIFDP